MTKQLVSIFDNARDLMDTVGRLQRENYEAKDLFVLANPTAQVAVPAEGNFSYYELNVKDSQDDQHLYTEYRDAIEAGNYVLLTETDYVAGQAGPTGRIAPADAEGNLIDYGSGPDRLSEAIVDLFVDNDDSET